MKENLGGSPNPENIRDQASEAESFSVEIPDVSSVQDLASISAVNGLEDGTIIPEVPTSIQEVSEKITPKIGKVTSEEANETARKYLSSEIQIHTTLPERSESQLPRNRKGIMWKVLEAQGPESLKLAIELEAKRLQAAGIKISNTSLKTAGQGAFLSGIGIYYVGGITQLQRAVGAEVVNTPKNHWKNLENIEGAAREILALGMPLNSESFRKTGRNGMGAAVSKYYPGGYRGLRVNLGQEPGQRGRGYWNNPANIEAEIEDHLNKGGTISQSSFRTPGRSGLWGIIKRYYPDGIDGIRRRYGIQKIQKDKGFWTKETIEHEVEEFIRLYGGISYSILVNNGRTDLAMQIRLKYPGGRKALCEKYKDFDKSKRTDSWTIEEIERVARQITEEEGDFTSVILNKLGRSDLLHAINKYYPGGTLANVRIALGFETYRMPKGGWTEERIETEASIAFQKLGKLSHKTLKNASMYGLLVAITRHYPGGMLALKEKLGITEQQVSSVEANEAARRFLDNHE